MTATLEKTEVVPISTSCEKCVFAQFTKEVRNLHQDWGMEEPAVVQNGCYFNRLNKFDNKELIKVADSLEYYKINRICNYYSEDLKDSDDPLNLVNTRRTKFNFYIYHNATLETLKNTILSCTNQIIRPEAIFVTVDNAIKPYEIKKLMDTFCTGVAFKVRWMAQKTPDGAQMPTREAAWQLECDETKNKVNYYCFLNSGFLLKQNFTDKIDQLVNSELKQLLMVVGDDYNNGLAVHRKAFRMFHGFALSQKEDGSFISDIKQKIQQLGPQAGQVYTTKQLFEETA